MMQYDVMIIGGGVSGCSIARELSFYNLKTALIERGEDVCCGSSKANSAIVHAGFDAETGTLKAIMNVDGNKRMPQLCEDLDIAYKQNGSLVLCFSQEDMPALQALYDRGIANGVNELSIISGEEARKMEPALSENVVAALYAPTAGIICPFELTIAMAENAAANGVEFIFNEEVKTVEKKDGYYLINGKYQTKAVVNAAGLYADMIHNQICEDKLKITPKKGDYCLLDKETGNLVEKTIFQLPTAAGKGVLVTPTVHGNTLVGPSSTTIDSKENKATTQQDLDMIIATAQLSVNGIPFNKVITSFTGLRAHEEGGDFILKESADYFFDAAGIESPGLTSAPAIGAYIAEMVARKFAASKKDDVVTTRIGIPHVKELNKEERKQLIASNPLYGNIICRCEEISEGEIVDAIHRMPGAVSLDGVKRRVRAGMGRCQGGFCSPKVMAIIARELGVKMEDVHKNTAGSKMVIGRLEDRS